MSPILNKNQPLVSAIIVNYNTKRFLIPCLESLMLHTQSADIEIIVVDNNSMDNSVEEIKRLFPSVKLIESKINLMFAGGVNKGIEYAQGKYFLILNPDIIINPQTVLKLANYLEKNPKVVGVSPLLLSPTGEIQKEFFLHLPSLVQLFLYYSFAPRFIKTIEVLRHCYYEVPIEFTQENIVEQLPGACMLVSSKASNEVGVMDNDFTLFYEDVDWCVRLSKVGLLVVKADLSAIHHGGSSHEKREFWIYGRFRVSMLLYFRKHFGKLKFLIAKSIVFTSVYIGLSVRYLQKVTNLFKQNENEYHIRKYKFFFKEFTERKPAFDKYKTKR